MFCLRNGNMSSTAVSPTSNSCVRQVPGCISNYNTIQYVSSSLGNPNDVMSSTAVSPTSNSRVRQVPGCISNYNTIQYVSSSLGNDVMSSTAVSPTSNSCVRQVPVFSLHRTLRGLIQLAQYWICHYQYVNYLTLIWPSFVLESFPSFQGASYNINKFVILHQIFCFRMSNFCVNQFTLGILYFFWVFVRVYFQWKFGNKFLAINNFFVNETKSGQPNKCLIHWHFEN